MVKFGDYVLGVLFAKGRSTYEYESGSDMFVNIRRSPYVQLLVTTLRNNGFKVQTRRLRHDTVEIKLKNVPDDVQAFVEHIQEEVKDDRGKSTWPNVVRYINNVYVFLRGYFNAYCLPFNSLDVSVFAYPLRNRRQRFLAYEKLRYILKTFKIPHVGSNGAIIVRNNEHHRRFTLLYPIKPYEAFFNNGTVIWENDSTNYFGRVDDMMVDDFIMGILFMRASVKPYKSMLALTIRTHNPTLAQILDRPESKITHTKDGRFQVNIYSPELALKVALMRECPIKIKENVTDAKAFVRGLLISLNMPITDLPVIDKGSGITERHITRLITALNMLEIPYWTDDENRLVIGIGI